MILTVCFPRERAHCRTQARKQQQMIEVSPHPIPAHSSIPNHSSARESLRNGLQGPGLRA